MSRKNRPKQERNAPPKPAETSGGDPPAQTPEPPSTGRRLSRRARWNIRIALVAVVAVGASYLAIKARWWKAPYPPLGKRICWVLRCSEEAYNFDVVAEGKLYRSGRPDERWYRYVHDKYGVRHVISLMGADGIPAPPAELGMKRTVVRWYSGQPPSREELQRIVQLMATDGPVLVHCYAGADRTGYAIAAYRILHQGWPRDAAFTEMNRYWHSPKDNPKLQEDLRKLAAEGGAGARTEP